MNTLSTPATAHSASWMGTKISDDGTHHTRGGLALYARRFEQVGKFHDLGLAPVLVDGEAWHIRVDGSPAYEQRYLRTYGFYEGRAAVRDEDGWFHIGPDGAAVSPRRYAWCGNFQEGRCPASTSDGAYVHVGFDDAQLYAERWRYAGDYKDGIAVVQAADGRHTHVDDKGALVHRTWFVDLDVFHKGLARARDASGWTHVRRDGVPAYARRFASVEPFYNDHARVELHDGSLEVISPDGAVVHVLRSGKGVAP